MTPGNSRLALGLILAIVLSAPESRADAVLHECQDNRLAVMNAADVAEALRRAGGVDCKMREAEWGETVICDQVRGARAFGLTVTEFSAEIHDSGRRSLMAVTSAHLERTRAALATINSAPGLRLVIEGRDDGTSSIRCVAEAGAAATGAAQSGIRGATPPLPPGAGAWQVCAQPPSGPALCATADAAGNYLIAGLPPGEYGLLATPIAATDPLLRAVLAKRQVGETPEGGPRVLADRISVREGATAVAGSLTLLRLPPGS